MIDSLYMRAYALMALADERAKAAPSDAVLAACEALISALDREPRTLEPQGIELSQPPDR